jgi:hypothetical protein
MHATHLHPRLAVAAALVFLAAFVLAAALPARLGDRDLSFGGGGPSTAATSSAQPGAFSDPLAELPAPARWPPAR